MNSQMAGTERTFEYVVYLESPKGRIGVRDLKNGSSRIRVEPYDGRVFASLSREAGWKQPGDDREIRHSIVVSNPHDLTKNVTLGMGALL